MAKRSDIGCTTDILLSQRLSIDRKLHDIMAECAIAFPPYEQVITEVQAQVRECVLRLFKRRGLLSPEVADAMREWVHAGGFSLNADVTVPAWDRSGLERLFRYCARLGIPLGRIRNHKAHGENLDLLSIRSAEQLSQSLL